MTAAATDVSDEELRIALENRAFEIQLFWQRSNYFLVLMTALGIGVFTIKDPQYAFMIAVFAAVTSWYWYQTNLGSKFWQESWEVEVVELAQRKGIESFKRSTADIRQQVKKSLDDSRQPVGNEGFIQWAGRWVRKWIDKQIVKKPSVSHYMILLSLTSMLLWLVVAGFYGASVFSGKHEEIRYPSVVEVHQAAPPQILPPSRTKVSDPSDANAVRPPVEGGATISSEGEGKSSDRGNEAVPKVNHPRPGE